MLGESKSSTSVGLIGLQISASRLWRNSREDGGQFLVGQLRRQFA
jgi:hypothetical protein